jgi:hypothetical protein
MKFKTLSAICLAATSVFAASSAMAWESEDGAHSTSANVGLFSDYLFRGISFSDDNLLFKVVLTTHMHLVFMLAHGLLTFLSTMKRILKLMCMPVLPMSLAKVASAMI